MVLYISLEIVREDREKLYQFIEEQFEKGTYCFLKRKGENVAMKAHLTLLFGIEESEREKILQDPRLQELTGEKLRVESLEVFPLGSAPCKVLVLRVEHPKLSELRAHFLSRYHIHPKYREQAKTFKPHISLLYFRKYLDFNVQELTETLTEKYLTHVRIEKGELKFFGPRK